MIKDINPYYHRLNERIHAWNGSRDPRLLHDTGYVLVVYHEFKTFYIKRTISLVDYAQSKQSDLKLLSDKLPKSLHLIEQRARMYDYKAQIYYINDTSKDTQFLLMEMMVMSGYSYLMSRVSSDKGQGMYIYEARTNLGFRLWASSVTKLTPEECGKRMLLAAQRRIERERRYNTAAWVRITNLLPGVSCRKVVDRVHLTEVKQCQKAPFTAEANTIKDVNRNEMIRWGNEYVPQSYSQMVSMREQFERTGTVVVG